MSGYTDTEQMTGQRAMIVEGLFSRAMEGMTSGVVLAGFALALGATEFQIGLIAAIPFLAQLAHLPAVALLGRFPDPKRITLLGQVTSRGLFVVMATVPFLPLPVSPLVVLIPLLALYSVIGSMSGAAWQVWIRSLVPRASLGAYFGKRMALLGAVGLVVLLAAGQFLSWWRGAHPSRELMAFSILFAVGGLVGYGSPAVLFRAPSAPLQATPAADLVRTLRRPVQDGNYRRLLAFLGAWGFAANFALPFITVVLLTTLGYSFSVVTGLAALSVLANMVGFKAWAPLTDRFGNKPILGIGATLFVTSMVGWALIPKVPGTSTLVWAGVVHAALGLATAALDLASNGVIMKLAPDDAAAPYLASASVVRAVATGVAPLLGGALATILAGRTFLLDLRWIGPAGESTFTALRFSHHDFLFLGAAVLGLYAVHRLLGFQEVGETPPEEVLRAVRRDVTMSVTSVAGMRQFAHVSSYVTEAALLLPRRRVKVRRGERKQESRP